MFEYSLDIVWPVLLFLAGQTLAAIKWGIGLTASMKSISRALPELKKEIDGKFEQRDGQRLEHRLDKVEQRLYQIRHRETPQNS